MEYNKQKNDFFEIDYSNKVYLYDKATKDACLGENYVKIDLSNDELKRHVMDKYKLCKLPCFLYYKQVIYPDVQNLAEVDEHKHTYMKNEIDRIIKSARTVLFLKGDITNPYCRYSKKVVEILRKYCDDMQQIVYYDVLMNEEMRNQIKAVNQWPTFPQLFVDGEFIGGYDIIMQLDGANNFSGLLNIND